MFCTSCGSEINEGTKFCPKCGSQVGAHTAEPAVEAPVVEPAIEHVDAVPVYDNSVSVLVMGILAIALSEFGIPGIIFGAIAKSKAKKFLECHPCLFGKAKVGNILGKVGFIVGIVMTVFWIIYFLAIVSMVSYLYTH